MDRESRRRFEEARKGLGPVQNQVIDDLNDGAIYDRETFLKRGTMFGLSASVLGAALVAAGEAPLAFAKHAAPKATGRLRVGLFPAPPGGGNLDPWEVLDSRLVLTHISGEFLTRTLSTGRLVPELGTSWKPNADASQWTFKLRPNVKFQSGQTLSPDDVIGTFKHLLGDPTSQALSSYKGILSPGNVTKGAAGDEVVFQLDGGNASFPYLVSNTVYQSVILPSAYQPGTFASRAQCTGAYMITKFNPGVSASYDRFTGWWGGTSGMQGVDVTIYNDTAPRDAALLGGTIDMTSNGSVSLSTSRPLFLSKNVKIFSGRSSAHSEVVFRVDKGQPFADPRLRQAVAYSIDRPNMLKTLYGKYADIGNDHPFAPVYPSMVAVPQRAKNLAKAKALWTAAGGKKMTVTMTIGNDAPQPQMGEIIKAAAAPLGLTINLQTQPDSVYYAGDQNTTPWLNTPFNITGWGSRPIPNVYLTSELHSGGIWNAPHIADKPLDKLIDTYVKQIALKDQQKYALQIEKRVQAITPILYLAFTNNLAAGVPTIKGYDVEGNSFNVSRVTVG
jgi:peptide/nickel transport system substrate-binding protein